MSTNNGLTGALETTTLPIAMTISAFTAIAWYNVIDLNVVIWVTFKRRHGLYFYSLLVSSWGIALFALSFLMKFFDIWKNPYVSCVFITIGWYAMVTGQSLVLYSRLHLVVYNKRNVRWVLYMIITSVFLFHFPTTVMTFGVSAIAIRRRTCAKYPFRQIRKRQSSLPLHIRLWRRFRLQPSVYRNSSSPASMSTQHGKSSSQGEASRRSAPARS